MSGFIRVVALLVAVLLSLVSCGQIEEKPIVIDDLYELPHVCDFNSIRNNSTSPNECSPILKDNYFNPFKGLLINVPKNVVWPKDYDSSDTIVMPGGYVEGPVKLNVAGVVKLPYNTMGLYGDFSFRVVVVVVNQDAGKSYSGNMIRTGFPGARPDGFDDPQKDVPVENYFNMDVFYNLGLPFEQATYSIYAVLGEHKSNVSVVNVVLQ